MDNYSQDQPILHQESLFALIAFVLLAITPIDAFGQERKPTSRVDWSQVMSLWEKYLEFPIPQNAEKLISLFPDKLAQDSSVKVLASLSG